MLRSTFWDSSSICSFAAAMRRSAVVESIGSIIAAMFTTTAEGAYLRVKSRDLMKESMCIRDDARLSALLFWTPEDNSA